MSFDLRRPEHLADEAWTAVDYYRARFASAAAAEDRPGVVGAAKELIESVAHVVVDATETTLEDRATIPKLVHTAQAALERTAGDDVSGHSDVRVIARAAQNMALSVAALRNDVGVGHGRARVADIDVEMVEVVIDATMLWCRWALRRLGHLLAGYPHHLLEAVSTGTSQSALQRYFTDVQLPDQPSSVQEAIGVAFGRQSAGGFGNATVVGVAPAAVTPDLDAFPADYRLGVARGMVLTYGGQIGLIDSHVPRLVGVLEPVPGRRTRDLLLELAATAGEATWIPNWRKQPVDPLATVAALREEAHRLAPAAQPALRGLADALQSAADAAE